MNDFSGGELRAYDGKDLSAFISREEVKRVARSLNRLYGCSHAELADKTLFLKKFSELGLVKRKFYNTGEYTKGELRRKLTDRSYIVKPNDGSWGRGVRLWFNGEDIPNNVLIEERVKAIESLWVFNVTSLNTIRVITIRGGETVVPFASQFRSGVGRVTDNAHTGGLFAEVDVSSGTVTTDFVNIYGKHYGMHPNSRRPVKGITIPMWGEVIGKSVTAALNCDNIITGWDIAVTHDGEVEFIEGNSCPDFDMVQIPTRVGCRELFYRTLKDVVGYEPSMDEDFAKKLMRNNYI